MTQIAMGYITGIILLLATPRLYADDDAADAQARQLFEEGIRLFKDEDFEGASIAFNRAYELRPSYKILFNVGQVESELKHYCRALKAYTEYVEAGGAEIDTERRADVEKQIGRLTIFVGSVEIEYGEDGVTVLIDEERYGATPLEAPICVDMGTHDLSLRKGVEEIYRESFRIAGGQQLKLNLGGGEKTEAPVPAVSPETDPPDTPAPAAEQTEPSPPESEASTANTASTDAGETAEPNRRKWTWITLGAGAALGAAGGIIGGVALAKGNTLEGRCDGNTCDATDSGLGDTISALNLSADILFGAAGACAVAAIVLFFVEPKWAEKETTVGLIPGISPAGVGVTFDGRF